MMGKGQKRSRRNYGEGSVSSKPRKDGRYSASFMHEGKRKTVYGQTYEEAKQNLVEAKEKAKRGELVDATTIHLAKYLEHWLDTKKLAIKRSSHQTYALCITGDIVPELGTIQLQKLTRARIQQFVTTLLKEELKPNYIRHIFGVLKRALEDAVKWQILSSNPCVGVVLPKVEEEEMQVLNADQAKALLKFAQGKQLEALISLALATGMRQGELLGLKWADIDFEQKKLTIHRTIVFLNGEGRQESTPKTKRSRRTIMLASFAIEALKRHRQRQLEQRLQTADWIDRDLVFGDWWTGDYFSVKTLLYQFHRLLEQAGLPAIRFHDLRHSCATLLLTMGVDIKVIQAILGHTTIAMTLRYLHFLASMGADVANRLDDLFGPEEAIN